MEILNNAVALRKLETVTFEKLAARLESIENMIRAGYKAEALEILNVARGMVANLERQHETALDRNGSTLESLFTLIDKVA